MVDRPTRGAGLAIVLWAVLGVVAVLVEAIVRLLPRALEPLLAGEVDVTAGLAYLASILTLAYFEGYRGFQLRFSPRVIARAQSLDRAPIWVVALAPLMAMGLIYATRRRLIASWCLVFGIVSLVILVALLDQPWRGAVDAGVVVGLSWGTLATLLVLGRALQGRPPQISADLPEGAREASSGASVEVAPWPQLDHE